MSYNPLFTNTQFKGSSRSVITNFTNGTLFAIPQGMAVSTDTAGNILPTDVNDQVSVQAMVGYANVRIPAGTVGPVIIDGRLENITTTFVVGDAVYVGTDGNLINYRPDYGVDGFVSGDFVIFVGVIVKNEFSLFQKDLQLFTDVIGQL